MKKKQAQNTRVFLTLSVVLLLVIISAAILVMSSLREGQAIKTPSYCWTEDITETVNNARDISAYLAKDVSKSYKNVSEAENEFEKIHELSQNLISSFTSQTPSYDQLKEAAQTNQQISQQVISGITKTQANLGAKQGDALLLQFVNQLKKIFVEVEQASARTIDCIS